MEIAISNGPSGEDTAAINCGKGYEEGRSPSPEPQGRPPSGRRPCGRSKIRLEKEFQLTIKSIGQRNKNTAGTPVRKKIPYTTSPGNTLNSERQIIEEMYNDNLRKPNKDR